MAMSNRSKSKKDLELDILHGTKIIGDCSKCNSIMGMEEGLKENIGGPKMNALTGSEKDDKETSFQGRPDVIINKTGLKSPIV